MCLHLLELTLLCDPWCDMKSPAKEFTHTPCHRGADTGKSLVQRAQGSAANYSRSITDRLHRRVEISWERLITVVFYLLSPLHSDAVKSIDITVCKLWELCALNALSASSGFFNKDILLFCIIL